MTTLTLECCLILATEGNAVPKLNMKQRENEWNSCFDGISNVFFSVFRLVGSHYATAENIYRVQSHSVQQPEAGGRLSARCGTISGQREPHNTGSALPRTLGPRGQMGHGGTPQRKKKVEAFPLPRTQKRF